MRSIGFEQRRLDRLDRLRTDPVDTKPAVDMSLAAQIVLAGERRRTPDVPMTTDKTALAILAAGRKRRGET
jgi:hypothetical protein